MSTRRGPEIVGQAPALPPDVSLRAARVGAGAGAAPAAAVLEPPPLFRISAPGPYAAGVKHGALARERIAGWFATVEMQGVFAYVATEKGSQAFTQLKHDNAKAFPEYAEELRGIAEGAGVPKDHVWCANMLNELEGLMAIQGASQEHCSDIYAISPEGYAGGFAHGHNDDWSDAVKPFWYFVSYEDVPGFADCAGVAYPAATVGWAPTWNRHGMFSTQNSMVPRRSRAGGLAAAFVQRRAVCPARNLDEAVAGLTVRGWSDGASMNVVDVRGKRMANIELWEDRHSVVEVTEAMGNYSHFNEYKHLSTSSGASVDDPRIFATDPRQGRVDELPPPRSRGDVMARLSDPKVFRPDATITTLVIDGATGWLRVWCCGVPASSAPDSPAHAWNVLSFFGEGAGAA